MPDQEPLAKGTLLSSLPGEELPREKLMRDGRATLSDEELIAIFLRTGLPGCNVLELAARIKRGAGSLSALGRMEAAEISALCKGIGPAKAATLAAVFELGHRAARESHKSLCMDTPAAVYEYFIDEVRYLDQEHMYVLLLNTRRELIRRVEVGCGTLTRVVLHPRDIFREAVRCSASSIVLVHNHPSGCPTPSSQDVSVTQGIREAADIMLIPLLDHVIIGAPAEGREKPYYSFRENGVLK